MDRAVQYRASEGHFRRSCQPPRSVSRSWTNTTSFWETRLGRKCMGITCATGPFTSLFSTLWASFSCKSGRAGRTAIRWLWDSSAAGHVEAGEDYDETAVRELQEELGVTADVTRLAKLPASERTGQEFIWLYRAQHDGPFTLARTEIEHGEFFPTDVVSEWVKARPDDFAPGFLECWQAFEDARPDRANCDPIERLRAFAYRSRRFFPFALPSCRLLLPRVSSRSPAPEKRAPAIRSSRHFRNFRAARRAPSLPPYPVSLNNRVTVLPSPKKVHLKTVRLFLGARLGVDASNVLLRIGISSFFMGQVPTDSL